MTTFEMSWNFQIFGCYCQSLFELKRNFIELYDKSFKGNNLQSRRNPFPRPLNVPSISERESSKHMSLVVLALISSLQTMIVRCQGQGLEVSSKWGEVSNDFPEFFHWKIYVLINLFYKSQDQTTYGCSFNNLRKTLGSSSGGAHEARPCKASK